ncbi:MAG TPA: FAD-dependent monooxygenase [Devosiaceae bacterium]|nr:FAD-dependent monooxygenase [Devosiaceae bacterium]
MAVTPTDVLIVGAGPAGLATAIGLAQRNIGFRIIDALPEAQNTSRAAVIHAATLECLGELQVADRLITEGIKVPEFRLRDRDSILLHIDFSELPSATPYALMIPQDESEQVLVDRLSALGHTVERPVRLSSFEAAEERVRATCVGEGGQIEIDARFIVGADGESSTVRTRAAIDFPGDTYGSFLLADVRMDWPLSRNEVTLFFSEAGTLVVAPMSRDRYRVVAQLPGAPSEPSIADVQRVIDARGPRTATRIREVLWGSRFQVHHKLADRFRDGPVLLVGDAAHVHSPAGGQGMNLGLRDATALSGALADAIEKGSDEPLEAYATKRRRAAAEVLAMTDRLTRVATIANPAWRWARNRLIGASGSFPAAKRYIANTLAGY